MKLFILLFLFPIIANSQLHIGITGDSKTPFGLEIGTKKFNLIVMSRSDKSDGYTPIAYGNNTVKRNSVTNVIGVSGGIKIYKQLYTDLGLLLSSTSDVVNVSNSVKGSYNYDPDDGYAKKSDIGIIMGLAYYFEKVRLTIGYDLYQNAELKYGISYRF
jgi:hypothetical protein